MKTENSNKIQNIGIALPEKLVVKCRFSENMLPRVKAIYSDGSSAMLPVKWDLSSADFGTPGIYTVNGIVTPESYAPIPNKGDPDIIFYGGKYYFISTDDRDLGKEKWQRSLFIRCADTLTALSSAEDILIYKNENNAMIWAPELHEINGRLYIFLAIMTEGESRQPQSHVMELLGSDPSISDSWSKPVKILNKDGGDIVAAKEGISLDMTIFELGGKIYAAWSKGTHGSSARIQIALYDPERKKLISDISEISAPEYEWERSSSAINEGPFAVSHNGRTFLTYSANATNSSYCVGLLELNGDPLDKNAWTKQPYPLLASFHNASQPGPGHGAFCVNEHGDLIYVYHWGKTGIGRTAQIRTVHWGADGKPILYMDPEDEVRDEYKIVTMTIEITRPIDFKCELHQI